MADRDRSPTGVAGGVGALVACCTVHLLVLAGVIGGVSGFALGGIAVGAGVAAAAGVWLVAVLWRRRAAGAACRTPAAGPERHPGAAVQPARRDGQAATGHRARVDAVQVSSPVESRRGR